MTEDIQTRRAVLAGTGAVGAAALLAGCSTYGGTPVPAPAPESPKNDSPATGETTGAPQPGKELAKITDIPVGGGKIFEEDDIVITQPEKGTFKAFSATCTHQGCIVSSVEAGTINCACHGSKFKVSDGTVANGPAARRLGSARVVVEGDTIRKG